MINDIEGKLKDLSLRFKKNKKKENVLTPQQKNLYKLKKVWSYINAYHGPEFRDYYITNTPLPNYVQTMLNLLEMEERQLSSNNSSPVNSPTHQGISHSNQAGICMEFMLDNNIFGNFVDAGLGDQPFGLLQVVIESFSHLCGELNAAFLTRHSVLRSLNKLIYVTATTPKLNELYEDYLIELIFVLCQKMHENPTFINFFISPKKNSGNNEGINDISNQNVRNFFFSSECPESTLSPLSSKSPYFIDCHPEKEDPTYGGSYEFFIFNYLMNYYFKAGNQGDYALTAISILLDLDNDLLYRYLIDNDFPLVITASLCGSFASLPKAEDCGYLQIIDQLKDNLEFKDIKEFEKILKTKIDKEKELFYLKNKAFRGYDVNDELNIFLRIFQFIQKVTTECKNSKIVDLFLYYINVMFLKNILNHQLFSSTEIEEDDYSRIFYLKLIFNNLQSPALIQLFFKSLFPETTGSKDQGHNKYFKTVEAIYYQYQKAIVDFDAAELKALQEKYKEQEIEEEEKKEESDGNENENENMDENENDDENRIKPKRRNSKRLERLNSTTLPTDRFENPLAIIKEIEEKIGDPNYYVEKFKNISVINRSTHIHYAKELSLSKYATSDMNMAAIYEQSNTMEHSKDLYSFIVTRINNKESNGIRLATLQLLSNLLKKHNFIATHKLFPCYFYTEEKIKNCVDQAASMSNPNDLSVCIDIKGAKADSSNKNIKEVLREYLKVFHSVHHFQKLCKMDMDYFNHDFITHAGFNTIKSNDLQIGRYLDLYTSIELDTINPRLFIYPYILDVSSSVRYNRGVQDNYAQTFIDPLSSSSLTLIASDGDDGNFKDIDVSSYVHLPNLDEADTSPKAEKNNDDISSILYKVLDKDKWDDIQSIMRGFQHNQLLSSLLNLTKTWLSNPYEINLVLSGIFHYLLTSSEHLFLGQYLIMSDQFFSKEEDVSSFYTIIQQLIQKVNKNYKIIKSYPKIHNLYNSMYERLMDVQENINCRSNSSYVTLETAVDISHICDYNHVLGSTANSDANPEITKEFEALLQSMEESARQELLNMFKVSTMKNIIVLMELLKDIISSIFIYNY